MAGFGCPPRFAVYGGEPSERTFKCVGHGVTQLIAVRDAVPEENRISVWCRRDGRSRWRLAVRVSPPKPVPNRARR
jgi:hypothetical protein